MKKLLALLLAAAAMLALFAGCAPASSESSAAPSESVQPSESAAQTDDAQESADPGEAIKVGVTLLNTDSEWMAAQADFIVQYLTDAGFEPNLVSADNNTDLQMQQMENFAVMGCKAIVCQLVDPDGASAMIQQVRDQGIKVICIVFTPSQYDGLIRADQTGCGNAIAEMAAEWVNERYPDAEEDSVECGLIVSTINDDSIERCEGLKKIEELCPQVKIVAELEPENANSSADAMSVTENMLIANPNIRLILCYNAAMCLGVNTYITSDESPITDLSSFATFGNDIDTEVAAALEASVDNKSVFRGVNVINGGAEGVAKRVLYVVSGLLDGSLPEGYIYYSETDKVYPENASDFV